MLTAIPSDKYFVTYLEVVSFAKLGGAVALQFSAVQSWYLLIFT